MSYLFYDTVMYFPTTLYEKPELLLPETGLGSEADAALTLLAEEQIVASRGLTEATRLQILDLAVEPKILEFCPNDGNRFGTPEGAAKWAAKGRDFIGFYSGETVTDGKLFAYGWSGPEINKAISCADITIALRVGSKGSELAREIRPRHGRDFHMGQLLTELVLASAVKRCGADPEAISFEVWESNTTSITNGMRMGFELLDIHGASEERLTLQEVGEVINNHTVCLDSDGRAVVLDTRRYMRLANHSLLAATA
jgi:hypothetical protein